MRFLWLAALLLPLISEAIVLPTTGTVNAAVYGSGTFIIGGQNGTFFPGAAQWN
jgi:hypothetical protein